MLAFLTTLLPLACSAQAPEDKIAGTADALNSGEDAVNDDDGEVGTVDSAPSPIDTAQPLETWEPPADSGGEDEPEVVPEALADSVTGYAASQGTRGWYYGYVEPGTSPDFTLMGNYVASGTDPGWYVGTGGALWTMIENDTMHPNGEVTTEGRSPVEQWAVRRWVSSYSGPVRITGHVAKVYEDGTTTGVLARITINGVDAWSEHIEGWDAVGKDIDVMAEVTTGASVDFAVEPYGSDDRSDRTVFTATVWTVP